MASLPLILIYGLYLIFLIGFFIFSAFSLFHLEEYGYKNDFSRPMVYIYTAIAGVIMLISLVLLIF